MSKLLVYIYVVRPLVPTLVPPLVRPLVPPTVPTHNRVVGINIIIMNIMTTFDDVAHDGDVQGWDHRGDSCWNRRGGRRQR